MSKDMLSQDEIDALLRASNSSEDEEPGKSLDVAELLTPLEQDALGEIGNISLGSAATALSTLLSQKVDITTPTVSAIRKSELSAEFPQPHVSVHVKYTDGFEGVNVLVFRMEDAAIIADLMMGGVGDPNAIEFTDIQISAVQEAMNQMMGSAATSMSTMFNQLVNISPPSVDIMDLAQGNGDGNLPDEDTFIKVSFRLKVGDLIDSQIMQLIPIQFAKQMIDRLMGTGVDTTETAQLASPGVTYDPAPVAAAAAYAEPAIPAAQQQPAAAGMYNRSAPQMPPTAPSAPAGIPPYGHTPQHIGGFSSYGNTSANVRPAEFMPLTPGPAAMTDDNLGLLLDIPLKVTVELGRTKKLIKEILELSSGSIIELDKLAGEPVDILVNNKLIAKGEVVVIDENFGVRVTDIVSQWDRVQKLQ
ncbi:flagellar motor switch phosphatase FliY [Brevibacillus massiliensis]|uniref:flagellar motor switch phosphatase FliY n=1 Tax=Brevibacillus massiliensis TaxID=1118054 RepID=UPI0002FE43AB|nr:flagellar motor switch phosphatase FliY [Brevibacillus massiliensis]